MTSTITTTTTHTTTKATIIKPRKKILFFYNPHSGNGLFKNNLDLIIERLQGKKYQVVPVRAAKGKTIDQAFAEMKQEEYSRVIIAGGDGTINICVNSMIENNIHLPIGILPVGTANDFAYYFALPTEVNAALDLAMGKHYTYADVGVCNGKHFINVTALGNVVDVSQKTDPNLKNALGIFSYYLMSVSQMVNLKPLPVKLITPDETYEEDMFFMVVMNGKSAGGLKTLSPDSEINDGKMDVILFRETPIMNVVPLIIEFAQGKHLLNKHVLSFQTSSLRIESPVDISTDVDGEKGVELPLEFSILHKRLRIITADTGIGEIK
jgi:diacylglycerol kinase (ATP)